MDRPGLLSPMFTACRSLGRSSWFWGLPALEEPRETRGNGLWSPTSGCLALGLRCCPPAPDPGPILGHSEAQGWGRQHVARMQPMLPGLHLSLALPSWQPSPLCSFPCSVPAGSHPAWSPSIPLCSPHPNTSQPEPTFGLDFKSRRAVAPDDKRPLAHTPPAQDVLCLEKIIKEKIDLAKGGDRCLPLPVARQDG